jgi:hypothetical protein
MVDHHLYEGHRLSASATDLPGVKVVRQHGGAMGVHDLVEAVSRVGRDAARCVPAANLIVEALQFKFAKLPGIKAYTVFSEEWGSRRSKRLNVEHRTSNVQRWTPENAMRTDNWKPTRTVLVPKSDRLAALAVHLENSGKPEESAEFKREHDRLTARKKWPQMDTDAEIDTVDNPGVSR